MPPKKDYYDQPPPKMIDGVPVAPRWAALVQMHCIDDAIVSRVEHEGDARIHIDLQASKCDVDVVEDAGYQQKLAVMAKKLADEDRQGQVSDLPPLEPKLTRTLERHGLSFWITPNTATELLDQFDAPLDMWKLEVTAKEPEWVEGCEKPDTHLLLGHVATFQSHLVRRDATPAPEKTSWMGTTAPLKPAAPDVFYLFMLSQTVPASVRLSFGPQAIAAFAGALRAALSTVTMADWNRQVEVIGRRDANTALEIGKKQEDTTRPLPPPIANSPTPPKLNI